MTKIASSLFITTLLALGLHVASAQAQWVHTCVSAASGNDANSCHCTTPCRTFQRAHNQTVWDGQITVLDPGGYGSVTITKSISIVNDGGGVASIIVSGNATGVEINSAVAAYVNLRGLTIQGVGGGTTGVRFDNGYTLTMTNCVVRNHTGNGIEFRPSAPSNLSVSNTVVADNGGSGIFITPTTSGLVKAEFNRVEAYTNSVHGFTIDGQLSSGADISVSAADSVAGNNNSNGFNVSTSLSGASVELMMIRSSAVNNKGTGAAVGAGGAATARIYMGGSMLMGNAKGWSASGGAIFLSYGDNNIDLNTDGSPAPGTTVKK